MRKTIGIAVAIAAVAATGAALASKHREYEGWDEERDEHEHERERDEHGERREGARHEEHERHGTRRAPSGSQASDPQTRALYRKECGACHLDFPPSMLPAASHRQIMAGLERHFGQNAELDGEERARLERWLVENSADGEAGGAATGKTGGAPQRISQLPWFVHKHRRVDARVVARPSVKSIAHCAACHPGAGDWDFEDDRAKIPPG